MDYFKSPGRLKEYKDWLPLIIGTLVILGYFNLANYFSYFDISIFHFLDGTELLLLSFSDIMYHTVVWVCIFLILRVVALQIGSPAIDRLLVLYEKCGKDAVLVSKQLLQHVSAVEGNRDVKSIKKYEILYRESMESLRLLRQTKRNTLNRIYWTGLALAALGALLCFTTFLMLSKFFTSDARAASMYDNFQFDYTSLAFILGMHTLCYGILVLLSTPKNFIYKKYPYLVITFVLVLFFFDVRNGLRHTYLTQGKPKYNCSLVLRDSPPVRADSARHLYLGHTRNFLFFFDKVRREHTVIPMSTVVSLKLIKNHDGL